MTAELRKVNALAAGWPWCDLHDAPRWNGPHACYRSHQSEHVPQTVDVVAPDVAAELEWEVAGDPALTDREPSDANDVDGSVTLIPDSPS